MFVITVEKFYLFFEMDACYNSSSVENFVIIHTDGTPVMHASSHIIICCWLSFCRASFLHSLSISESVKAGTHQIHSDRL